MKKITTAICLTSMLMAGNAQAYWANNFLMGVNLGYINREGSFTVTVNDTVQQVFETTNGPLDQDSFSWGFLLGWQVRCNYLLYGLELSFDWQNHDSNSARVIGPTPLFPTGSTLYTNYNYSVQSALTARVGYAITPYIMPYLRAGAEITRENIGASITIPLVVDPYIDFDGSQNVWRFVGGVGVELPFPLLEGVTFRAEYNYHSRGHGVEASRLARDGVTLVQAEGGQFANSVKGSFVYNFL